MAGFYRSLFGKQAAPWVVVEMTLYIAFIVYLLATLGVETYLHTIPELCNKWRRCRDELKPSWHPTLQVDHSEGNSRAFRQSIVYLLAFAAASTGITRVARWAGKGSSHVGVQAAIGAVFSLYIFGPVGAPLTWALVALWYAATRGVVGSSLPSWAAPTLAWTLAAAALLGAEYAKTVRFRGDGASLPLLASLQGLWSGEVPWYLVVNMLVLRLISYTMDAHWAAGGAGAGAGPSTPRPHKEGAYDWTAPAVMRVQVEGVGYKARVAAPRPTEAYASLPHLFAYAFYPPLLLGGPTTTFNAWASHLSAPQTSYSTPQIALYLVRWGAIFALFDYAMHLSPVMAFVKHRVFLHLPLRPAQGAGMSWIHLNYLWLKFLVLWRFHRGWALAEGFEVPENMTVCVNNNFTIAGFWRGWHRSYNQWLVRYIYIPLGGSRVSLPRRVANIAVVFTFVALWHDMTARLLTWGWLLVLGMVPELLGGAWAGSGHWTAVAARESGWMRVVVGAGGAANVLALVVANFIGYSSSPAAALALLQSTFLTPEGGPNLPLCGGIALVLYGAVQLMMLGRAWDEDRSLDLLACTRRAKAQ